MSKYYITGEEMYDIKHTAVMSSDTGLVRTVTLFALISDRLKAQGMQFKKYTAGFFYNKKPVYNTIHYYDDRTATWIYAEVDKKED
jgi:hypothetical protein